MFLSANVPNLEERYRNRRHNAPPPLPQPPREPQDGNRWWLWIIGVGLVCFVIFLVVNGNNNSQTVSNPSANSQTTEVPNYNPPIDTPSNYSPVDNSKYAQISTELDVNLRSSPGYKNKNENTDVITIIPGGEQVKILGGPQESDGLEWWNVDWNGYSGWIADHTGSGRVIMLFNP